jgi:hypothetical protein
MNIYWKTVAAGQGKKYPTRACATRAKLNKMRYICEFWCVSLHKGSYFHRFHSMKLLNYQHFGFTQFSYKELSGISQVVSKATPCFGEADVYKTFGNWVF